MYPFTQRLKSIRQLCILSLLLSFCVSKSHAFQRAMYSSDNASFQYLVNMNEHPFLERFFSPNYDSMRGNGLMGVGWNIRANSSISKCQSTALGLAKSTLIEETDGYCLDGTWMHFQGYLSDTAHYLAKMPNGERFSIKAFGQCGSDPCYFVVKNGLGEKRWYGSEDLNVFNGRANFFDPSTYQTLVWSLSKVTSENNVLKFDYQTNPLDYSSLPRYAVYTFTNPNSNEVSNTLLQFHYRTRHDAYVSEVGSHPIVMKRLLSEIRHIDLEKYRSSYFADAQRTVKFSYNGHFFYENLLSKVEFCDASTHQQSAGSLCVSNLIYWRPRDPNEDLAQDQIISQGCERRWHMPYEHFYVCGNYLMNDAVANIIHFIRPLFADEYHLLSFKLSNDPSNYFDNNLPDFGDALRPLRLLKSVNFYKTSFIDEPENVVKGFQYRLSPSDFVNQKSRAYIFKWGNPRSTDSGRWEGFNKRVTTVSDRDQSIFIDSEWQSVAGKGYVLTDSYLRTSKNGFLQASSYQCNFASHKGFLPFVANRIERHFENDSYACSNKRKIQIDAEYKFNIVADDYINEQLSNDDEITLCDFDQTFYYLNGKDFEGAMDDLGDEPLLSSFLTCDPLQSLLPFDNNSPNANNTVIYYPPVLEDDDVEPETD